MTDTVVIPGVPRTARLDMDETDTLTVQSGATFSVSANNQSVRFNGPTNGASIVNDGLIENVSGRAVRFETSVGNALTAGISNGGDIQSADDAIQIQAEDPAVAGDGVNSGQLTISNSGTITSTNGQAVDLAGASGTFAADISNSGAINAQANDAIRIGSVGYITNFGTISGGAAAAYADGADGIQFEDNATGGVDNTNDAGGFISGDRHGINAGAGSNITVTNGTDMTNGGQITGRNGSGVGSDGTATVINYGTITGAFSDSPGSDTNGSTPGSEDGGGPDGINDGDGDGIDIDLEATIVNYGIIQGTGAGGTGSDGLPNTSEGIAAGGGSITNHSGATISGVGLGILIDDSSQGDAPFLTTIVNDGTITGFSSYGIRIISSLNDTIENNGRIGGGGGFAILFGSGANSLKLGAASTITGFSDGGAGIDTLDYSDFGSAVSVNLTSATASGTGGVFGFENVTGGTAGDDLTGNGAANLLLGQLGEDVLKAGNGDDRLSGGGGNDNLFGGEGADRIVGGTGFDLARYNDADYGNLTIRLDAPSLNTGAAAGDTYSSIEGIVAGLSNDKVIGNASTNYLYGRAGDDALNGLGGNDTLYGDAGADSFCFTAALGAGNVDRIRDFHHGVDHIVLSPTVFTGIGATLDDAEFGADADNIIIYNQATGELFHDADGGGGGSAPVLFATVTAGTLLDIGDFIMASR